MNQMTMRSTVYCYGTTWPGWQSPCKGILVGIEVLQLLHVCQAGRYTTLQAIRMQQELFELGQIAEIGGNAARQGTVMQIQPFQ